MQTHNSYFLNSSIACLCLWLQVSKSELTLTPSRYTAADHQGVLVCWGGGGFCGVSPCLSVSCSEPAASENSGSVTLSQRFMKVFIFLGIRETAKSPPQKPFQMRTAAPQCLAASMFGWSPAVQSSHQCLPFLDAPQFLFALLLLLHLRASCLVTTLAVNRPKSLETFCVYQRNQRSSLASSSLASSSLM